MKTTSKNCVKFPVIEKQKPPPKLGYVFMWKRAEFSCFDFHMNDEQMDLLVSLYELVTEKGGGTDLHSIVDVELEVKKRADIKRLRDPF